MVKRFLVNGCSFSRGPESWPYQLQERMQFDLVNLAQAGAGNDYIFQTTVNEIYAARYDQVIIMWSGINRVDYQVSDIADFNSPYTSLHQSRLNDWPRKKILPVNDQDLVEKDWVFGCGHVNGDQTIRSSGLFAPFYKFVDQQQRLNSFMVKLISLQNTLTVLDIPYVFSFYEDYVSQLQVHKLSKAIHWNRVCVADNLDLIAKRNAWFAEDGQHPGEQAHAAWADILFTHLCTNTLN